MPTDNDVFNSLVNSHVSEPGVLDAVGELFLRVTVIVPSRTDPAQGVVTPLVKVHDESPYVVVLTSSDALVNLGEAARFAIQVPGKAALDLVEAGSGVMAVTGQTVCLLSPARVAELRTR